MIQACQSLSYLGRANEVDLLLCKDGQMRGKIRGAESEEKHRLELGLVQYVWAG